MSSRHIPFAVVGAGISGLTVARELAIRERRVDVFEARDRIGGRVCPVPPGHWPFSVELGAEFVHGAVEPTLSTLAAFALAMDPVRDKHFRYEDHSFRYMGNTWHRFARLLAAAESDTDVPVRDFLDRAHLSKKDAELVRLTVEGFDAVSVDDVSLKSTVSQAKDVGQDSSQFRPVGGYGALIERITLSMPPEYAQIHLASAVEAIDWKPGGPCVLTVRSGDDRETVVAERCIVTVPVGVLQATEGPSRIRFDPALPEDAFPVHRLGMGHAVKLVLAFRDAPFASKLPDCDFLHFPGCTFQTFWREQWKSLEQFTAWAGGPSAHRAESFGARDLVDLATEQLAEACEVPPSDVRATLIAAHHHDFSRDPFSLGAYPFARPGGAGAPDDLSKPFGDCLFFAGDATDQAYFGTVAGALSSGRRAAMNVLDTHGGVRTPS